MKITRRQLRQLISEIRIKPSIPDVPSDDALNKIDLLARTGMPSADPLADAFGFPDDRSYSKELKDYDDINTIPSIELHKNMRAQDIINVYDHEYFTANGQLRLYDHIAKVRNNMSKSEFDVFLRKLAEDVFQHASQQYVPVTNPFHAALTKHPLSHDEGIYRIYQVLKQ